MSASTFLRAIGLAGCSIALAAVLLPSAACSSDPAATGGTGGATTGGSGGDEGGMGGEGGTTSTGGTGPTTTTGGSGGTVDNCAGVTCDDELDCTTDMCNPLNGECLFLVNAGQCNVHGLCVDEGQTSIDRCLKCTPSESQSEWTFDDGADCNDNNACTHTDTCGNEMCRGTAYSCDDSKDCTTDNCDGDGGCNYTTPASSGYCHIDNVCYTHGEVNPGNSCQQCDHATPTQWSAVPQPC